MYTSPVANSQQTNPSFEDLLTTLEDVTNQGHEHLKARCPAHADSTPSLDVKRFGSGVICIRCFAGCSGEHLAQSLNITEAKCEGDCCSYHPEAKTRLKQQHKATDEAITIEDMGAYVKIPWFYLQDWNVRNLSNEYGLITGVSIHYSDEHEKHVLTRKRKRLRAKDGSSWSKSKNPLIPYGLWHHKGINNKDYLILVEGETDCWALWHNYYPALGIPGASASKCLELKHVERFRRLYVWQEPDDAGEKFVQGVARRLKDLGYKGELLVIHHDDFKDPCDLWRRDPTFKPFALAFNSILKDAIPVDKYLAVPDVRLTEVKVAECVINNNPGMFRYCESQKGWLSCVGTHYQQDGEPVAYNSVVAWLESSLKQCATIPNPQKRKALESQLRSFQTHNKLSSVLKIMSRAPGILAHHDDFDSDHWLFNVQNGTVDLRTGKLLPHDPAHLITKISPVVYDEAATCPRWLAAMRLYWEESPDLIDYMQLLAGISLTGIQQKLFAFLWGRGDNGKSTWVEVLLHVMGTYAAVVPMSALESKLGTNIPNDVARLRGCRFATSTETEQGKMFDESRLKNITGKDTITARFLHHEFFDFRPQFKLFIQGNYKPVIRGTDDGIWNRLKLIPFTRKIPPERVDHNLAADLKEKEASGILNWMIEGCLRWQRDGIVDPDCVKAATADYRTECDTIGQFISEAVEDKADGFVTFDECYAQYQRWSADGGFKNPYTKISLGRELRNNRGWVEGKKYVNKRQERGWIGKSIGILASFN